MIESFVMNNIVTQSNAANGGTLELFILLVTLNLQSI